MNHLRLLPLIVSALIFSVASRSDAQTAATTPPQTYTSQFSGIRFVLVPAGKFIMGSENGEPDEKPVHEENISETFYMSVTEVTQEQWDRVMGRKMPNRSFHREPNKKSLPIENVSFGKAKAFCEELSKTEGRKCRLPTEAEWEYACRAGSSTDFCTGTGPDALADLAWCVANSGGVTHEVAQKKPNAWGLFDMHGNVWEYCDTSYFDRYDMKRFNSMRTVVRGGSYDSKTEDCRSANRWCQTNIAQRKDVGFRIVMAAK